MRRIRYERLYAILQYVARKGRRQEQKRLRHRGVQRKKRKKKQQKKTPTVLRYVASAIGARGRLSPDEAGKGLRCPAIFSFIEAPDAALEFFKLFADQATSNPRALSCDQSDCTHVDFCAQSVLNCLGKDLLKNSRVRIMGRLPVDEEANRIVRATGWPKLLNLHYPGAEEFLHHELCEGKSPRPGHQSTRGIQATNLTKYVDECLGSFGFELTAEAERLLPSLVSEVIDNAERHSGRRQWWIAGYMRRKEGAAVGDCHIVIFNFGKTVAESLQELPEDAILRHNIERLVSKHRSFFQLGRRWTEENLWTLYALQQGVSRKRDEAVGEAPGMGGQGTVDMITYFHQLGGGGTGKDEPVMALVSGKTYIRFSDKYKMYPRNPADHSSQKIIAFNSENDLEKPPDEAAVYTLRHGFPGTLISIRFTLNKQYLSEVSNESSSRNSNAQN